MKTGAPGSFGAQLRALREAAGFTQEELATIAGLSVHAVSALERGERRRPHVETLRALSAALDLTGQALNSFLGSARAPASPAASDELSQASLPVPLTALVGRDADMATLRAWLADPASRLITLIGPGGVGKTRLVLELGRAIADDGATRVAYVPLAPIRDASLVPPVIAEALGLTDVSTAELPRRARAACGDRPTLLVLDNFEHVSEAAPLVAELLAATTSLRLLVTSRAPLRVRGEREHVVAPLALAPEAEDLPLADLARVSAVRLFLERVRDVRPDFRLTPANAPTIAAICRRLDALPLALELAAPWLKVLSPENLLRRLVENVLLAATGPRDLPERQQTMNATVAWSYQLLDEPQRWAFRRLGVVPGLFPVDAAAEVLAGRRAADAAGLDALSAVAGLMDKSLLLRSDHSVVATCALYYMLETVRAYAAHQLAAAGEREDALEGLVRYCIAEVTLAADGLIGRRQVEWLGRAREDLDSYRTALAWLIEQRRAAEAAHIAHSLLFFWLIRGHATEGRRWYEQILALDTLQPDAEARTLLGAAAMAHTQGDLPCAREWLARGISLATAADDRMAIAEAGWMRGHVEFAAGNLDAARDWFTQSLNGFRVLGTPWGIGGGLSGLAWVALATGDHALADRLVIEALPALEPAGPWFLALGLYIRVVLALRRENDDEVLVLMRQSLTRVRESQDRFAVVYGLVPLAIVAARKGDDAWAARVLGARDAISDRTGVTLIDPTLVEQCEQTESSVRARLGEDRWAVAYAAGRKSSIDALLKDINNALSAR